MARIIGNEGKTVIKNIIVSVITTVTGAFAIYMIGFNNKSSGPSKLEIEERTVEAWKTLVTIENIYTKNSTSLIRDAMRLGHFMEAASETEKESHKYLNSIKDLIATDGIDKDLKSLLERKLINEQSQLPLIHKFYSALDETMNTGVDSNWTELQLIDSMQARVSLFSDQIKGPMDRAMNDLEALARVLSERYDYPFNLDDLLAVQIVRDKKDPLSILEDGNNKPKAPDSKIATAGSLGGLGNDRNPSDYFPDIWDANGAKITFSRNGKLRWEVTSTSSVAEGTWKYEGTRLVMHVTNPENQQKGTWEFNLSAVEENAFSMVLTKEPYNYYRLKRIR